jgi:hypothetical protein
VGVFDETSLGRALGELTSPWKAAWTAESSGFFCIAKSISIFLCVMCLFKFYIAIYNYFYFKKKPILLPQRIFPLGNP